MAQDDRGQEEGRGIAYRWTFANAEFDEAAWELRVAGEAVETERRPLDVLACLLRHAGEVVTKDELLEAAWPGRVVVEGALTNAIGKLRKALSDDAQQVIVTIPRVGYRLIAKVERRIVERRALATHLRAGDAIPRRPHWRLTRRLDDGDRGEVWLAEHVKTHEARVFKFSFDGSRLHSLKREVTIARLLHDSLGERLDFVTIIDWDFDDAPFFIESEFGGPNLEEWAQARGGIASIPLEARLRWLAETADALAAAHDVGVLHKDLKPANLLVRGEADDFHPRLVDFGSGKLLEPERLEALGITRLGITQTQNLHTDSLTGTPLYLAPELLAGQVPTVRSDIYALGVLLFQLCVGDLRRPLSAGWENEIDDPLLREDIAAAANGNPELRMDSAREFAQHLRLRDERRLCRETEAAALAKLAERERALARVRARRPWVIAAFVGLIAGLAAVGWMYRQMSAAKTAAERQTRIATGVNEFLNRDLLAAANPLRGGHVDVTMREALDKAAPQIDSRFAGDPRIAASVHRTAADAYYQLSDLKDSIVHYAQAATLFAQADGDTSLAAVSARVLQAQALAHDDQFDAARALLDQDRVAIARLSETDPMLRVHADSARGWLAFNSLHMEQAVPPLEDAVKTLIGIPDADPDTVLTIQQELVSARSRLGLPSESLEETQRRLLAQLKGRPDHSVPMELGARHLLARIEVLRGKGREMEQTYIDLVKDFSRVMGPQNENTLSAMHGLANVYTKLERWPECEHFAGLAYAGFKDRLGPDHINTLNALDTLAVAELRLGELDKADAHLQTGIESLKKQDGKLSRLLLTAFELNLVHVRIAQNRIADAAALVADIRANGGALVTKETDAAGELDYLDGRIKIANGDFAGAAVRLREAIKLLGEQNPSSYWIILEARKALDAAEKQSPVASGKG